MYEKRKNDGSSRFPRWLILIALGFALGVIVTLALSSSRFQTVTVFSPPAAVDDFQLTATALIGAATVFADATLASMPSDSPELVPWWTQTAVFAQETQQAAGGDALLATATALIQQATQAAANP